MQVFYPIEAIIVILRDLNYQTFKSSDYRKVQTCI